MGEDPRATMHLPKLPVSLTSLQSPPQLLLLCGRDSLRPRKFQFSIQIVKQQSLASCRSVSRLFAGMHSPQTASLGCCDLSSSAVCLFHFCLSALLIGLLLRFATIGLETEELATEEWHLVQCQVSRVRPTSALG